ncbi:N-acetylglucosamine-6-phosphate deacetylase [Synechococcus sp. RSCCF101]|nr:N-acetylglucosamine-6-phosphate deacetylase [Synechococcus sp. RSCCF101]
MRWLSNVRLPGTDRSAEAIDRRWRVGVDDDDRIVAVQRISRGSRAAGEDWQGDWLSPMGVDLQINGGLGLAFPELKECDRDRLDALLQRLWEDGVEAIAPTIVTCPPEDLRRALAVLREARQRHRPGRCRLLGAHLEGPFLAPVRRGAHPGDQIVPPSADALRARLEGFLCGPDADIAMVTLAPERPGGEALVRDLAGRGALVCLGHSEADEGQARAAFAAGVAMLTHTFNAMPGLGHRAPGPVAAALLHGGIALGLIADGVHVSPSLAVLLQRLAPAQLTLVSDALAPYGLGDGTHRWDSRPLIVQDGTCRLEDGTLAGVTLPLLEGVRRLAAWSGERSAAIAAATVTPWRALRRRPLQAIDLLLHRPLSACLRWSEHGGELSWRRNGEEQLP